MSKCIRLFTDHGRHHSVRRPALEPILKQSSVVPADPNHLPSLNELTLVSWNWRPRFSTCKIRNSGGVPSTMVGSIQGGAEWCNHIVGTRTATAIAGKVRRDTGEFRSNRPEGSRRRKEHVTAAAISATDKIFSVAYCLPIAANSSGPLRCVQTPGKSDDSVRTNQGNATTPAIPPRM